jgi:DNA-binding SARP family transcriptional activator/Tfp pilus assembly protein PilF
MRLGILGLLLVADDAGSQVRLPARLRTLLAALLVHANQVVAVEELVEIVWDGAPPGEAVRTVRSYVVRLRRALSCEVRVRIETRDPGYLCRVGKDELDVLSFEALCRDAGTALRAGNWENASDSAAGALALWRGEPLRDVPSQVLRDGCVPRLERLRVQAFEDHAEAQLQLGRYEQLVSELRELIGSHPLRERFHAQLMLALAAVGRRAEALDAYQSARRALVEQLGVEPGPQLRELHQKILSGDLALADGSELGSGSWTVEGRLGAVPRQLPGKVRHFAGRHAELDSLADLAVEAGRVGAAVVISAIDGMAGIGKTALAVRFAHQHVGRFPDGQLYVNLRGFDPGGRPLDAAATVRRFLDALAVPTVRIPNHLDAQIDLYRSLMADRRMLVLLDNARDSEQVRPLLPGAAGCLVLVTSRNRLTDLIALDGAVPLTLDLLSQREAHELMVSRLGRERVGREEHAVNELIDLCARLPLALNVIAARAAAIPDTPLRILADELRGARLDLLSAGQGTADLRAALSCSYRTLSAETSRIFRLLGVHPGPDITAAAAASLAAFGHGQARRSLDELVAVHLLTEHVPGRYALHDLLRVYAAEEAGSTVDNCEAYEALYRVADHYLQTARTAAHVLDPVTRYVELPPPRPGVLLETLGDYERAWGWFTAERAVLLTVVAQAADHGLDAVACQLPVLLSDFLDRSGQWGDWATALAAASAAAGRLGDHAAQARVHRLLARVFTRTGAYPDAQDQLDLALDLLEQLGDTVGQGQVHLAACLLATRRRNPDEAETSARRALELFRAIDHTAGQAYALNNLGWSLAELGEHQQALSTCEQALHLHHETRDREGEAAALDSLGYIHHQLGHYPQAVAHYREALKLRRELGDRYDEAETLARLGDAYQASNDVAAARNAWQKALQILADLKHPDADAIHGKLHKLTGRSQIPELAPGS